MLANGTLLGVKLPEQDTYTDLPNLKTLPDMNNEKEKVENTPVSAANKRYEYGVGDYGDMEYTFVHEKNEEGSAYRILREYADNDTALEFQETWPDGTKFTYTAVPSIGFKRGGGTNTVVDLVVKMALKSDIAVTDPA